MRVFPFLVPVLALPASGDLRINEVHADPPGVDLIGGVCYDYVEIISDTGGVESLNNCKLLLLDTDGGNMGRVDGLWNLSGLSTGTNGLLLLGLNFAATGGGPWADHVAPGTAVANLTLPPDKNGLVEPNRAWSLLLVRNFNDPIIVGTTDLSPTETMLTISVRNALLDSVGYNQHRDDPDDLVPPFPIPDLSQLGYSPDSISRTVGNFMANSSGAWFGGDLSGTISTTVDISPTLRFGTQPNPAATPGAPNIALTPAELRINEVMVNPGGADGNFEYVELIRVGGTSDSGQGHHLLVVNTDPGGDPTCGSDRSLGVVVEAWNLSSVQFGPSGLALLGDDYDDGLSPWRNYADAGTTMWDIGVSADPDPVRLSSGNIGNEIRVREGGICVTARTNAGFSLLLVRGFTGAPLQDLDTNDDGVLDAQPWTALVDSVGYNGAAPTYAQADLNQAGYEPDNLSRKAGDITPNSAAAFYGGNIAGSSPYHVGFGASFFGGFRGQATPGRANLASEAAPAALVLNEVNFNPPGDAAEFIELRSVSGGVAPAQGLTLLIAATDPGNRGEVLRAYDLGDYSTGANGLLLMGDSIETQAAALFPPGTVRAETSVMNGPPGFMAGDLPDQSFALLLAANFGDTSGTDLDLDGDGAIDAGYEIVDGITFGALSHPAVTDLSWAMPAGNVSRAGSQWYGGTIAGTAPGGLVYESAFGPWTGTVTPGQHNHAAAPLASTVLLNEVHIDPPGDDGNFDYLELISTAIAAQSMNDLALIVIDTYAGSDGLGGVGAIDRVWNLDGLATGRNGLLLLGNGYPAGGPFDGVKSPLTATGDPLGMDSDPLAANEGIALVLVRGFSGTLGQDLDATNDGVLDTTPWTEVIDAVVIGDVHFGFPDLSQVGYRPDNLSRGGRPADLVANDPSRWYGGDVLGAVGSATALDPAMRFDRTGAVPAGAATPGQLNLGGVLDDGVDNDLDSLVNLMERSLGTDLDVPDRSEFPRQFLTDVAGQPYLALRFSRVKGGTGTAGDYTAGGIRTVVQVSDDLATWTAAGSEIVQVSVTDDSNGYSETVVVRLVLPVAPGVPQRYLRLEATRL